MRGIQLLVSPATIKEGDDLLLVGGDVCIEAFGAYGGNGLCQVDRAILTRNEVVEESSSGEAVGLVVSRRGTDGVVQGGSIQAMEDLNAQFCRYRFEHDGYVHCLEV